MWKTLIVGLALLGGAALALGFFWPFGHRQQILRLPGVVEIQEVRLGSKVGGRVGAVLVQEGDLVKPGQELVRFDEPELEAQHKQWLAKAASARADYEKAKNGPRKEEIAQARSDLNAAQADEQLARLNLDRAERLFQQNALALADFDAARSAEAGARAKMASSRARLDLLLAGSRPEDIASMQALWQEAEGKVQELKANLNEAVVRAPELAVVNVVAVRQGDLVAASTPVVRVLRVSDLWVKAYVPETELGKVRLGEEVQVTLDAYPGRGFSGRIYFIESESEFTPRNVQSADERRHEVFGIRVRVPQPEDPGQRIFKAGLAAEVSVPLQEAR